MKTHSNDRYCHASHRDNLPAVFIPGSGITITESACMLFTALVGIGRHFYQGGLVEIVHTAEGPRITPILPHLAVSELEQYVRFVRRKNTGDGSQNLPATITSQLARQYLNSRVCREKLPNIKGLLNIPLLLREGNQIHLTGTGFDPRTGFYILSQKAVPKISWQEGAERIKDIIRDYDFSAPGDRSRAIASILTPALRFGGFISGHIPADVGVADESQAGKTYRQALVAAVYNEEVRPISQHIGGVGSLDEAFAEKLVEGRPFIQFDNLRGTLNSTRLESFLTTTGEFGARIPNRGSINVDPTKYIILVTSNAFRSTIDLANRSSIIAIRKRPYAEYRGFMDGHDLREHIKSNYEQYLGAVYAVIKYWHKMGSPRTDDRQHSFRDWCQKLDWIVQNIFKEAPLMEGHRERQLQIATR